MKKPKVSIIIPMYNVAEYIEQCIDSVLSQDYSLIELVLIDDGSTDDTLEIARRITFGEINVIICETENHGPAHARNIGIQRATGDYLMFVDSDDYLSLGAVTKLVQAAIEDDSLLVLGKTMRTDGENIWEVPSHRKYQLNRKKEQLLISQHPELFFSIGPAAKLYHVSLLEEINFDEKIRFAEDQLFVLQAYIKAKRISILSEIVYYYRVRQTNNQSLTQTYQKNAFSNLKNILLIFKESSKMIELNENYSKGEKDALVLGYFNRLCEIELRVLFKSIYREDGEKQQEFFCFFLNTLTQDDPILKKIIKKSINFNTFIKKELQNFYFLIKDPALDTYVDIIILLKQIESKELNPELTLKIISSRNTRIKRNILRLTTAFDYLVSRLGRRNK